MLVRVIVTCLCMLTAFGCAKRTSVVADRLAVGDQAPQFVLSDIFGKSSINSGKVFYNNNATVVVIWSLACPTCREALIEVQKVYEKYSSKSIVFLGVNYDAENARGVRAVLKAEGIEFPTLWDGSSRVTRAYKALDYTFSIFVIGRDGRIVMSQYDHPPGLAVMLAGTLEEMLPDKHD